MQCQNCLKPSDLCICALIQPIENQVQVLILQHPQEPDHELGSARISQLALKRCQLRIGLSWRNLQAALGEQTLASQWAVLYLGSGVKGEIQSKPLQFVNKKGVPIPAPSALKGIIVLDGTWSQAKSLWWRNPWLLKVNRAILIPQQRSLYKELRREPRKECLSTIESVAEAITALGEPVSTGMALKGLFAELLERKRARA